MDELTRIALLGTSKFAGPIPKGDHPAAALAAGCAPDDREESLLLQCGAQAVYALAGRSCEAGIEESAPAREESRKQASRKVAELLEGAAAERENTLLLEFLREMQVHDVVLPPHLLPQLLEFKDAEVRRRLVRVLGERGAWLCGQNPDWAGAVTAEEDPEQGGLEELRRRWDEGAIDERRQAIERLRTVDPDRARGWVEEVYSEGKTWEPDQAARVASNWPLWRRRAVSGAMSGGSKRGRRPGGCEPAAGAAAIGVRWANARPGRCDARA